jgi:hypothetical protein
MADIINLDAWRAARRSTDVPPGGIVDLYEGLGDLVGVDACVSPEVADGMFFAAAAHGCTSVDLVRFEGDDALVSLQVEIPPDALEAVLAPARAAGVRIVREPQLTA